MTHNQDNRIVELLEGMLAEQKETNQRLQAVESEQKETNTRLAGHEKRLESLERAVYAVQLEIMATKEEQVQTRQSIDTMKGEQVLLRDEFERMRTSFLHAYEMSFDQLEEHLDASLSSVIKKVAKEYFKDNKEDIDDIKRRMTAIERRVFSN
jgi:chromosome segregation ATPase